MQKICLIIPFYNEEKRFSKEEFLSYYNTSEKFAFCFVNDGSSDGTINMLNKIREGKEDRILLVNLSSNKGKAHAVRQGIIESLKWKNFLYVGYMDADLSTPFEQMNLLAEKIENNPRLELVLGSRVKLLGNSVERKALRHYSGRVFSTFASIALDISIYDTQCGAKIFISSLAEKIFQEDFLSPWLFDVEIFARFIKLHGKEAASQKILELPLEKWMHKAGSKLNFFHVLKAPFNLLRIYLKYREYL
jgi:glycosyltransferase involved in cell wall biosynthesis